jgi:DNA repair protein RecO
MQHISTKAITLRSFFFKDKQKITTAFSEKLGMISMIMKKPAARHSNFTAFSEMFCEAEVFCTKKNSDLLKFEEGDILNLHLPLRGQFAHLQTASELAQALLRSQMPGKPAPALYNLFSSFLRQIPHTHCLNTLKSCFYVKILIHDGLYHPNFHTSEEREETLFSQKEELFLQTMAYTRQFSALMDLSLPEDFFQKVERFFLHTIE